MKQYAKCGFKGCFNKAEWAMGTWQCCDECAKKWITPDILYQKEGWGVSLWGSCSRVGQEALLKHNLEFNLKFYLVDCET